MCHKNSSQEIIGETKYVSINVDIRSEEKLKNINGIKIQVKKLQKKQSRPEDDRDNSKKSVKLVKFKKLQQRRPITSNPIL